MRYSVQVNLAGNAGIGAGNPGHRYGVAAIWLENGYRPGGKAKFGSNRLIAWRPAQGVSPSASAAKEASQCSPT